MCEILAGCSVSEPETASGSELRSCFSPFMDQSTSNYVTLWGRHCRLQRRFPIYDILLQFEDICNLCKVANWRSGNLAKIWCDAPTDPYHI